MTRTSQDNVMALGKVFLRKKAPRTKTFHMHEAFWDELSNFSKAFPEEIQIHFRWEFPELKKPTFSLRMPTQSNHINSNQPWIGILLPWRWHSWHALSYDGWWPQLVHGPWLGSIWRAFTDSLPRTRYTAQQQQSESRTAPCLRHLLLYTVVDYKH